MRSCAIALLCAATFTWAHAGNQAPDAAMQTVDAYSRAMMAADCDEVIRLSGVLARHPEATEGLCAIYKEWSQQGLVERLRTPTARLLSGADRLVVVPNSRIVVTNGRPQITNGVYLVYSKDAGRGWKVIDIGCDRLKDWVKGVYPAYDGHPTFSATVDIPVASR